MLTKVTLRVFSHARRKNRRGLTLMELVVVLTILAGLAALLVPLFPNLLRRSHKATEADQTHELAKALQLYQGAYSSYPDGFDTLTDTTGAFPSYMPADNGNTFGGNATATTLTAAELKALTKVGIVNVHQLASTTTGAGFHPTTNPYAAAIGSPLDLTTTGAAGAKFAVIDSTNAPSFMQAAVAADPTARYVVFGVGSRSTMIGKTLQDAPILVPDGKDLTPANAYTRLGVIFKVSGAEVAQTERARFIAAVVLEDDEIEGAEGAITGYYSVSTSP